MPVFLNQKVPNLLDSLGTLTFEKLHFEKQRQDVKLCCKYFNIFGNLCTKASTARRN